MQEKLINVTDIESKIGYVFKDKSLLVQAFTRTSFCNEHIPSKNERYQSNEVLEFFGDGVLSVAIISFLLKECTQRYAYGIKTELGEGDFSNIKSKLSDKQNLSKSMKSLGLQRYLRMGEGDAKLGVENEPSVMEDLFESIVGAIYIDSGMSIETVIKSVSTMLDMSVYTDNRKPMQSAKNALQEWCADKKRRLPAPRYETLSEDGPDHKKTYMRGCYIGDRLVGRGVGKNFKLADAIAAEDALNALMNEESANLTTKPSNNTVKHTKTTESKKAAQKENESNEPVTPEPIKKVSPMAKLKAYASSQKKPNAIFRDLGENKNGNLTECRVECIFAGESTVGTGSTRSEARESATMQMVNKIGIGAKKKKATASKRSSVAAVSKKPETTEAPKAQKEKASKAQKEKAPAQSPGAAQPKKKKGNGGSPAKRHAKVRRKPIVKI